MKERHAHVYKKESSRFHSSVKSDLDKGMICMLPRPLKYYKKMSPIF